MPDYTIINQQYTGGLNKIDYDVASRQADIQTQALKARQAIKQNSPRAYSVNQKPLDTSVIRAEFSDADNQQARLKEIDEWERKSIASLGSQSTEARGQLDEALRKAQGEAIEVEQQNIRAYEKAVGEYDVKHVQALKQLDGFIDVSGGLDVYGAVKAGISLKEMRDANYQVDQAEYDKVKKAIVAYNKLADGNFINPDDTLNLSDAVRAGVSLQDINAANYAVSEDEYDKARMSINAYDLLSDGKYINPDKTLNLQLAVKNKVGFNVLRDAGFSGITKEQYDAMVSLDSYVSDDGSLKLTDAIKAGVSYATIKSAGYSNVTQGAYDSLRVLSNYSDLSAAIRDGQIDIVRKAQAEGLLTADQVVDAQINAADTNTRNNALQQIRAVNPDLIKADGTLDLTGAIKAGIDGSVIRNAGYTNATQTLIDSIKDNLKPISSAPLSNSAAADLTKYTKDGGKSYDLFSAIVDGKIESLKQMSHDLNWEVAIARAEAMANIYLDDRASIPNATTVYPKDFHGFNGGFTPVDSRNLPLSMNVNTIPSGYVGTYYDEFGREKSVRFDTLKNLQDWEVKAKRSSAGFLNRLVADISGQPVDNIDVSPQGVLNAMSYPEMQLVMMGTMLPEMSAGMTSLLTKIPKPVLIAGTAGQVGLGAQQTIVNWNYMNNTEKLQAIGINTLMLAALGAGLKPTKVKMDTATYQREVLNKIVEPHTEFVDTLVRDPVKAAAIKDTYYKMAETVRDYANVELQLKQAQKVVNDIGLPKNLNEEAILNQAKAKIDIINGSTPVLDVPNAEGSTALRTLPEKPVNLLETIRDRMKIDIDNYQAAVSDAMKVDDPTVFNDIKSMYRRTVVDMDSITNRIVNPRSPEVITNEMVGIMEEKNILLDNIKKSTDPVAKIEMNKMIANFDRQLLELANENYANFIGDGQGIQKLLMENNKQLEQLNQQLQWADTLPNKEMLNGKIAKIEGNIKLLNNMKLLLEKQTFEGIQKYTEPVYGKESYGDVLKKLNEALDRANISTEDSVVYNWKVRDAIIKKDVGLLKGVIEQLRLKAGEVNPKLPEGLESQLKQIETDSAKLIETKLKPSANFDEGLAKEKQDLVDHEKQLEYAEEHLKNVRSSEKRSAIEEYIEQMKKQVERKKLDLVTKKELDIDIYKFITPEEAEKLPKPAIREEITKEISRERETDIARRISEAEAEIAKEDPGEYLTRPYRVITPSRTFKETGEHIGTMTPEQAQRLYGEESQVVYVVRGIPLTVSSDKPAEWLTPQQLIEQANKIKRAEENGERLTPFIVNVPNIGEETRTTTITNGGIQIAPKIGTITGTDIQLAQQLQMQQKEREQTQTETQLKTKTNLKTKIGTDDNPFRGGNLTIPNKGSLQFPNKIKPGTIQYRSGKTWVIIPPPYGDEDKYYSGKPLPGTTKFSVGKGSAYRTLAVLGGLPAHDVDVDMGWAQVHIDVKGRTAVMTFSGGEEAIAKRRAEEGGVTGGKSAKEVWLAELEKLNPIEKEAYEGMPQNSITQKIKYTRERYRKERHDLALDKPLAKYPPEMLKREWHEYSHWDGSPIRVYKVDGDYVRTHIDSDFTQGGHWKVYDYIPKNEVWIERMKNPVEDKLSLIHEMPEIYGMTVLHMPYLQAHSAIANPLERKARQNQDPEVVDARLHEELDAINPPRFYLGRKLRNTSLKM